MTAPFLQIRDIRKDYGDRHRRQRRQSRQSSKGEFMTFLGPSGSGKSTTLYVLAGFAEPDVGRHSARRARRCSIRRSHKRNIGMVFQRYTLFPHLTVGENIAFPLRVRRRRRPRSTRRSSAMLKLVRLEGFEDRKPAQMSGGQQQRVALARALAYDPPVLLMDEPLSALDKKLREEIQHEIRRIHQETGVTILYVTHDQEEALRLSDRIAVFSKGVIDQVGTGAGALRQSRHPLRRGIHRRQRLPTGQGAVGQRRQGRYSCRRTVGDVAVCLCMAKPDPAADAAVMLRPERISLSQRQIAGDRALAATVKDITFLGNNTHVQTETATREPISVRLPFGHELAAGLKIGQKIWMTWEPTAAHAFC